MRLANGASSLRCVWCKFSGFVAITPICRVLSAACVLTISSAPPSGPPPTKIDAISVLAFPMLFHATCAPMLSMLTVDSRCLWTTVPKMLRMSSASPALLHRPRLCLPLYRRSREGGDKVIVARDAQGREPRKLEAVGRRLERRPRQCSLHSKTQSPPKERALESGLRLVRDVDVLYMHIYVCMYV